MPVVCVWVPAFRLAVARLMQPGVDLDAPLVLADRIERGRVVDCTLTAAALGVRPGMTLVQAQAVAVDARTVFDDPAADARVWAEILEALDAASPIVEDGGLGRAFLEMHGIAGDPAGWLAAVRGTLAGFDLPVRVGFGPNRFVAHAATWRGDPSPELVEGSGQASQLFEPGAIPRRSSRRCRSSSRSTRASRAAPRGRPRASGCGCSA